MKQRNVIKIIIVIVLLLFGITVGIFSFVRSRGDFVNQTVRKYNPQGSAVILIQNGEIEEVKNYGYADKASKKEVNEHTKFKIASISKTVTAYAVMQLVDDKILDLDTPVNQYLKSWKIPESEYGADKVTLRTLMSHTSGITGSDENGYKEPLPTIAEALKSRNIQLKRNPGEQFEYSEFAGFGICQLVIEDVTGMKFEDYMKQNVFERLGMYETDYSNKAEGLAIPYAGYSRAIGVTPIVMNGGGGVTTTSNDLQIFVKELIRYYNEGNKIMFQPQENTQSAGGLYALGIIPRELKNGKTVYEHNGTLTGWNAQIVFEPTSQNGMVVLTNSDKAYYMTYELMEKWGKEVLGQPVYDLQMLSIHKTVRLIIVVVSIILMIYAGIFYYQKEAGKIVVAKGKRIIVRSVLTILFIGAYILLFYTRLPFKILYNLDNYYIFTFLPKEIIWVYLEVLIFLVLWILHGRFYRKR
jgi:CubicO group peptidase (beta-lactamase class C family)